MSLIWASTLLCTFSGSGRKVELAPHLLAIGLSPGQKSSQLLGFEGILRMLVNEYPSYTCDWIGISPPVH